jgi:hypothetical protein
MKFHFDIGDGHTDMESFIGIDILIVWAPNWRQS